MDYSEVRLIVTDMDGTLLNEHHEVSEQFYRLYERLKAFGVHFAAASGRQHASIREKLCPIADEIAILAENGAYGTIGGVTLTRNLLEQEKVGAVLREVSKIQGGEFVVCTSQQAYVLADRTDFHAYMREFYTSFELLAHINELPQEVIKLALYHPESSERYLFPYVKHFEPALKVKISGLHWVDISDPQAHKGNALAALQQHLDVTPAQTMAFGDYLNDLELLAGAKWSYAMANAHEQIASAARYSTKSNREKGVEEVLEKVVAAYEQEHS